MCDELYCEYKGKLSVVDFKMAQNKGDKIITMVTS